jgi:DNA adenine methylase
VLTKEHFYHVGAKETNRNPMLEALVTNFPAMYEEPQKGMEQLTLFEGKGEYSKG